MPWKDLPRTPAKRLVPTTPMNLPCPDCGGRMALRESKHGTFYGCTNYPICKGTRRLVRGEADPNAPDTHTRTMRSQARDALLILQSKRGWSHGRVVAWLTDTLNLEPHQCDVNTFDAELCEAVIGLCNQGRTVERND